MSTASSDPIRLASTGETGACLHNGYILLTQLSTLYAQVASSVQRPTDRGLWDGLCESALADLGDVFRIWETTLLAKGRETATAAAPEIAGIIVRACRRAAAVSIAANVWTPQSKYAGILRLIESRWHRIVLLCEGLDLNLAAALEPLAASSRARSQSVERLIETRRAENARIDSAFDYSFEEI